jgi:hypothetical protein
MPQPGVSSSARALWAGIARAEYGVAHPLGTQFTCFTGTKVQKLTQNALLALALRMHAAQVLREDMGVTGGGGGGGGRRDGGGDLGEQRQRGDSDMGGGGIFEADAVAGERWEVEECVGEGVM